MIVNIATDFVGDKKIVLDTPSGGDAQKLEQIIESNETDILIELIGEMYGDFITNNADAKYQSLINGGNFVYNGVSYPFIGLRTILAYRLYYLFKISEATQSTSIGEVQSSESSVSPMKKIVDAWNKSCTLSGRVNDSALKGTLYNYLINGDFDKWTIQYQDYKNTFSI